MKFEHLFDEDFDVKYVTEDISNYFREFNGDNNSYKPDNLVGLGPYQVTEWKASQYITLERKNQWWGEAIKSIYNNAYPEKIIFKIIKDDAAAYLALKSQKIDVSNRIGTIKLMKLQERD